MRDHAAFEIALKHLRAEGEEIKVVWVFEDLLRELRFGRWQGAVEIGKGPPLPRVESTLDLVNENIAAPPVLDGLPGVPKPLFRVLYLLDEGDVVVPG